MRAEVKVPLVMVLPSFVVHAYVSAFAAKFPARAGGTCPFGCTARTAKVPDEVT
jgi:hypothetical protein